MYIIHYTHINRDNHTITCSFFEDAEKVAGFISTISGYRDVYLSDGYSNLYYVNGKNTHYVLV